MTRAPRIATPASPVSGTVLASRVKVEIEEVELKGLVSGLNGICPNVTFLVNDTPAVTNGSTKFDSGCSAVQNGKRVEVEGVRQTNGSLLAKVGEIDDRTRDLAQRIRPV